MTSAFVVGVLAGLAVAMPLGPVGVLLLRTGLVHGVRLAAAGACGVATTDLAYAVVAVAVGSPVSRVLGAHAPLVRALSATVLVAIGVAGLLAAARPVTADAPDRRPRSGRGTYVRFLGLTAVNPLTAVTFAAIAVGLASRVQEAGSVAAFVVGAGVSSLAWQLLLALVSGLLGLHLPPGARTAVSVAGSVLVVLAGLALVV